MALSDDALDTLYAAPATPELWADVLVTCMDMVGAGSGWVNELDCTDRFEGSGHVRGVDAAEQDRYFAYYASLDPFRADALRSQRSLGMICDENFISKRSLVSSEFYNDYMSPIDVHSILILRMYDDGRTTRSMHLNYSEGDQWSDSPGWDDLRTFYGHLKRAAGISAEFARIKRALNLSEGLIDSITCGVIYLDASGRVCAANRRAEAALRGGEVIRESFGRLRASAGALGGDAGLGALVARAVGAARGPRAGGSIRLAAADGDRALTVTVTPLSDRPARAGEPAAVVSLRPEPGPRDPLAGGRDGFGLTPAEDRIASLILAGHAPREIADTLRITRNTYKTHLKSIYAKLDVRRQSELVLKLARPG